MKLTTLTVGMILNTAFLAAQDAAPPSADRAAQAYPGEWNQWRGPDRTGHVRSGDWPTRLSKDNFKLEWRVELGPSYSGAIVSDSLVFTTSTEGKKTEVVTAVDRQTGKVAWRVEWEGSMKVPFFAARNGSWIRSTPACDGESVFVAGMLDVLVSLDAKTGKENWRVDFPERFKSNRESFGFVCSPLFDEESVYVQTGAGVVKLDKKTGETVWLAMKDDGGMNGGAFASPVRATIAGQDHLLVQSRSALSGIHPESGDVLWSQKVKTFRGMNILTPLPFGDAVFTSAYGGRGHLFGVEEQDGKLVSEQKWTNRVQAYMSTPVVLDGHAYVYLRSKRFCCVQLESGELKWTSSSITDENWSMVAYGDRLLALSEAGELYLIAANTKEYEVIDVIEVAESETWAHLAVDGNQVLIRELDGLSAFAWR
jgi:outer membrane protein assembly factor BamB